MNQRQILLDNTLRYLNNTIAVSGCRFVAIEFTHRGKRWRADTVEEAMRLREKLETEDARRAAADPEFAKSITREGTLWTEDRVLDLLNGIGLTQRRFLEALAYKAIDARDMEKTLGLDSQVALAGVLSGLSKQLRSMGIAPVSLYLVDTSWHGKKKERTFSLARGFKVVARDMGWPNDWIKKRRTKN